MPERFLLTAANVDNLMLTAQRHLAKHKRVQVTFEQPNNSADQRTYKQNSYMWPLVRQIGEHLGSNNERATLNFLLLECFGDEVCSHKVGDKTVRIYPSTSKFTKRMFSQFLT